MFEPHCNERWQPPVPTRPDPHPRPPRFRIAVETASAGNHRSRPAVAGKGDLDPHALKQVTYPAGTGNAGNDTKGLVQRSTNGQPVSLAWDRVRGWLDHV